MRNCEAFVRDKIRRNKQANEAKTIKNKVQNTFKNGAFFDCEVRLTYVSYSFFAMMFLLRTASFLKTCCGSTKFESVHEKIF